MKELTKAEEQVMQVLWELEKAFVKDILQMMPKPKPAYSTVSTIIRILETKGFVAHEAFGPTHRYYPVVKKDNYSFFTTKNVINKYFDGSMQKMLSFFADKKEININEMEEIIKLLEKIKNQKK